MTENRCEVTETHLVADVAGMLVGHSTALFVGDVTDVISESDGRRIQQCVELPVDLGLLLVSDRTLHDSVEGAGCLKKDEDDKDEDDLRRIRLTWIAVRMRRSATC